MAKDRVQVVSGLVEHAHAIKDHMREDDNRECFAMAGRSAAKAVVAGMEKSYKSWTILYKGKPCGCFGVTSKSSLMVTGIPWLLGTDDILKIGFSVVRRSRMYVKEMIEDFDRLENYVDIRNTVSVNWIKWCGYTVEEPKPYGLKGELFCRFYMEKEV